MLRRPGLATLAPRRLRFARRLRWVARRNGWVAEWFKAPVLKAEAGDPNLSQAVSVNTLSCGF